MISLRNEAISEMNTPTTVQALTFDKKNEHLIAGLAGNSSFINIIRWPNNDL
jgi:hypothetical protein